MMKLLLGGSPCTHWSIAQTKNRETEPSGIGWELFRNYLIAWEKFQPDYFLYENNKSMAQAIRAQITAELGVEPVWVCNLDGANGVWGLVDREYQMIRLHGGGLAVWENNNKTWRAYHCKPEEGAP